jgi:regulatory protein
MNSSYKLSENDALERLRELCSRAEKSEYDISKKLDEWGLEDKAEAIISNLRNDRFLDNSRYARAFVIDKIRFNKWGKYKVTYLLRGKKISENDIRDALGAIDPTEYKTIVFEELKKKKASLRIYDLNKIKASIYAFGNQRGYESEIINEFIRMIEK